MINSIEKKILILILTTTVVLMTAGAVMADANLNVPVYKQGDSQWSTNKLGSTSWTIGNSGCAITSISMVFKYYGVQTDPKDLNTWLTQNSGYTSVGAVKWDIAAGRSGRSVQFIKKIDYLTIPADLTKIKTELNNGYPVIAEVRYAGAQHFVVIKGYSGSTYYINDPIFGAGKLSDHYGNDPAKAIYGIRIYHPTVPSISSISPSSKTAGTFSLTIYGSNFDTGAVDQIYWSNDGHFVGQGTVQSRTSSKIVVTQYMTGATKGNYIVKVKNSNGQISNGKTLTIT